MSVYLCAAVYLRKVERAFPDASKQFAAFIHDLFKAVASTPQVALVYTLAVGKDDKASAAYKEENERAAAAMSEAESVAVRSTMPLNPTEEDETPNVLRARLFETVDLVAAQSVIAAYSQVWNSNRDTLPVDAADPELRDRFARSYPLHPKLLEMLTEKTSSLSTFQRTRGMLRFTNQHAYPAAAEYFNDLADLGRIDWPLLQSRVFRHDPDEPGKKERYQAEALIWKHVPLDALLAICCHNETVRSALQADIDRRGLALRIQAQPNWYF